MGLSKVWPTSDCAVSWIPESSCSRCPGLPSPVGHLAQAPCSGLSWDWFLFSSGPAGQFLHPAPTLGLTLLSERLATLPALASHFCPGVPMEVLLLVLISHVLRNSISEQVTQQVTLPLAHGHPHTDSPIDTHTRTHMGTHAQHANTHPLKDTQIYTYMTPTHTEAHSLNKHM